MVPLILLPLLVELPGSMDRGIVATDWFIWAVFAFEYVTRLALTPTKWRFVRHQWPDLLIVVLPFLRPLRIVRSARALRLLRLGRPVSFLSEIGQEAPRLFARHGLHYALLISTVVVAACRVTLARVRRIAVVAAMIGLIAFPCLLLAPFSASGSATRITDRQSHQRLLS